MKPKADDVPAIAITSSIDSGSRQLIKALENRFSCTGISDRDLIERAGRRHNIKADLLSRVIKHKPIAFNRFTHDRERCLAALKTTLSDYLAQSDCLFHGTISHLIPDSVTHLFRILTVSSRTDRICRGMSRDHCAETSTTHTIDKADQYAAEWVNAIKGRSPWDEQLYHMVVSPEGREYQKACDRIQACLDQAPFKPPHPREQELFDFRMACEVELVLHPVAQGLVVTAANGHVLVTLDKKVMNLAKVQKDIISLAGQVKGIRSVKTRIGPNYYRSRMTLDFNRPSSPYRTKKEDPEDPNNK